jgi:protein-tyrosine phosphatase
MSERRVVLDGLHNFRDLGGLPTEDRHRVRRGQLFRSESLHHLAPEDGPRLAELGIATALDFRAHDELDRFGIGHLGQLEIRHVHLPTVDRVLQTMRASADAPPQTAAAMYLGMLDHGGSAYAAGVRMLVEPDALPAVFFCYAGKDRTGLFAAFVLGLLGVSDADVVADYILTHEVIELIHARGRAEFDPAEAEVMRRGLPPALLGAQAETMIDVLAGVKERYGSWRGYAAEIGLNDDVVGTFCESLTESVPPSRAMP